jgi:hypothetical protein
VDDLVKVMGGTGVSKSQVSRLCEEIDARVKTFLDRTSRRPSALTPIAMITATETMRAVAVAINYADVCLRDGFPLIGGRQGLRVILRHVEGPIVHQADSVLRNGIPLVGQRPQELHCRRVIRVETDPRRRCLTPPWHRQPSRTPESRRTSPHVAMSACGYPQRVRSAGAFPKAN